MENKALGLAVFLTNGSGLNTWKKTGSLSRETALYKKFAQDGWNVSFFTYDRTKDLPSLDFNANVIPQHPFNFPKRFDPLYRLFLPMLRSVQGKNSSIIITNQAHSGSVAVKAARRWKVPVIARCGMIQGESSQTLGKTGSRARKKAKNEKWTFTNADRCVVPTKELATWLTDNYGIDPEKITIIPNYVDTDIFTPKPDTEKKYDVLCIGRLVSKKRHQLLLESLAGSNLKICIIGAGKQKSQLTDFARDNNMNLEIFEKIEHSQLPQYFHKSRMYVNVAAWEGHPKAMIEAMACGIPCIGAKSPGIANLLKHNQTGLLVDPEPDSIRNAVQYLLSDNDLVRKIATEARNYCVEQFSLETIFLKYKSLFTELIQAN